jgi:hypothetical protein
MLGVREPTSRRGGRFLLGSLPFVLMYQKRAFLIHQQLNARYLPNCRVNGILRSSLTAWLRNAFRNALETVVL